MNRRTLLTAAALAAAANVVAGHTPYGHWVVYRRKHLLIGCHRGEPRTYRLAREVAAALAEHLPPARARVARAPFAGRLASLLATDQLDVAVLEAREAEAMARGRGDFAPYGTIPLQLLVALKGFVLLAHARFPARHAWLVSSALHAARIGAEPLPRQPADLPVHPGARALYDGRPEPPGP